MRRYLIILIAIVSVVSCKKSEIPPIPGIPPVRIAVVSKQLPQGVGTRAVSIDGFNTASQMGLYATLSPSTDLSSARNTNVAYGNPNGSQYWDAVIESETIMHAQGSASLNLFAYHPHIGQEKSTVELDPIVVSPTLIYSLPLDQSVDSTLVRADLMWGRTDDVKPTSGVSTKVEFIHKLSKVTFNIFKGADWGVEQATISELRMSGTPLYKSARLELSSGLLSAVNNNGGEPITILSTFASPLAISSFEARKCDFIAIPVEDIAGVMIEFVVNGSVYKFLINAATIPSASNRSLVSGHNRVYNVTINKFSPEQVYVTTTMVPWNVVSEIDIEGI